MVDFNPIRDLRSPEDDPFNVPAGQSTQEVEDIRLRLVLTREKTENVVKIIKNKGLTFKKDIEKIQELQRRLRTTIPRIPILRGDASTQIGSQVGLQRRGMSGLDFSRFFRSTKTATKTSFPLLDVIITAIVFSLSKGKNKNKVTADPKAVNKIVDFIRGKQKILPNVDGKVTPFRDPSKVVPFKRPVKKGKGTVIEGDASQRTVDVDFEVVSDQNILERVTSLLNARRLRKFSKEKGFLSFSKDADKIPRIPSFAKVKENISKTFKINKFRRKINPKDNRFFARRRKPKGADAELDAFIQQMVDEGQLEKFVDLYRKSPTAKNLALRDDFEGVFRVVRKVLQTGYFEGDPKSVRATLDAFTDAVYGMIDQGLIPNVKMKNFLDLLDYLDDVVVRTNKGSGSYDTFKTLSKKRFRRFESLFENIRREMINPFKDTSNINTKPMSNDIAMLNTDTGYRDIYVIQVDSNSIG